MIIPNIKGNKTVQQKDINWSNLIRGNEALVQINTNIIIELFIPKFKPYNKPSNIELFIILFTKKFILKIYEIILIKNSPMNKYPPINNILVNIHINTILPYSAKKKNTKTTAACSVINPLTNSDSV